MRKFLVSFLLFVTLLANAPYIHKDTTVHSAKLQSCHTIEQTVYKTKTGKRYHLGSCRYLKYSCFAIEKTLAEKSGLTPCKVCKPNLIY